MAALLATPAAVEEAPAATVDREVCQGCGTRFASRSKVFRHLKETGCGGHVPERVEKFAVVYGYDGRGFHGSQTNGAASEAAFPTAEGRLCAAVERHALASRAGATACEVGVSSRTSRTDRGVHALGNSCFIVATTRFEAGVAPAFEPEAEGEWLDGVNAALRDAGVRARALRRHASATTVDLRKECFRRDYRYELDYGDLGRAADAGADDAAARVRLGAALKAVGGTRSYHNFTNKHAAGDDRAVRNVHRCAVSRDVDGPRCVVEIVGKSFLYRQILSMVGLAVDVAAGRTPLSDVPAAFAADAPPFEIPLAPADRLVLVKCALRYGDRRTFGPHAGPKAGGADRVAATAAAAAEVAAFIEAGFRKAADSCSKAEGSLSLG